MGQDGSYVALFKYCTVSEPSVLKNLIGGYLNINNNYNINDITVTCSS